MSSYDYDFLLSWQICDDSNQASAFSKLYAAVGAGRLLVSYNHYAGA